MLAPWQYIVYVICIPVTFDSPFKRAGYHIPMEQVNGIYFFISADKTNE